MSSLPFNFGGQDMVNKTKNKVAIAVACQDTVKAKTMFSLVHALRNVDFEYDLFMQISCDLIGNRIRLVRQAIESGATHMLFLDHDMFFKDDSITKLLAHNKDIIGAPYNFRSFPLKSTAAPLSDISDKAQIYRCNTVATGFLLIKLSVFEKVSEPWFDFGRDKNFELACGEDSYFCQKAIKAGFDVWADPNIFVKHCGEYMY